MSSYLFLALAVFQVMDIATTYYIIRKGIGYEANRMIARLIDDMGLLPGLVIPKVLVMIPAYMAVTAPIAVHWAALAQDAILAALVLLHIAVVTNNLLVIRRGR
ncbi:MAG TPA: DUF5658 family protein [Noviherbaspirillum sp.]|nr:DUF5658 family protein [Noviherbaspirillum sp.]